MEGVIPCIYGVCGPRSGTSQRSVSGPCFLFSQRQRHLRSTVQAHTHRPPRIHIGLASDPLNDQCPLGTDAQPLGEVAYTARLASGGKPVEPFCLPHEPARAACSSVSGGIRWLEAEIDADRFDVALSGAVDQVAWKRLLSRGGRDDGVPLRPVLQCEAPCGGRSRSYHAAGSWL